jgi:signal transduction histidine kinase/CheY-like chemotaxis protein
MIVASIAISFLGVFTSTQLMCHARISLHFSSVFVWALLGSLIFGFCSIWSLHEVAMLAYEFDLPIGVDAPLTILSALLAVSFTFAAMAGDLLYDRYRSGRHGRRRRRIRHSRGKRIARDHLFKAGPNQSSTPLLRLPDADEESNRSMELSPVPTLNERPSMEDYMQSNGDMVAFARQSANRTPSLLSNGKPVPPPRVESIPNEDYEDDELSGGRDLSTRTSSDYSYFRRHSAADSSSGSFGLSNAVGFIYRDGTLPAKNAFVATAKLLYFGFTFHNILNGFIWSLAITSMHYVGIFAIRIPNGYFKFNPGLLVLSAVISWVVCTVGFILMAKMETHLPQQILFSVIATTGVAAMHFTGMAATTFWTAEPASGVRGFPPALGGIVAGVAFVTCIAANVLLSHSATVSRNKLAEIVWTRKELFKNIALKEHAEAAARSRSEFITSASHEIRTPLHHLQGYSDLLAQTELTEEGRALLTAIQRATKTLSLLTNNVLDWSKFEGNSHGEYRPTAVDIRTVCESMVTLLPNVDDDATIEIYVVVAQDVPKTLFLDESWIHRIIMNLLSNSLKFTKSGYILLSLYMQGDNLVAIVKDTGCGLDPNFIPDMWTPFKQGEVRGSARGTGLGLSIIRQLLHRMDGSIDVESKFEHTEGVGPEHSGTKFTVTVPISSPMPRSDITSSEERPRMAILSDNGRSAEGLQIAWECFGFDVSTVRSVSELGGTRWKYVWAELSFLSKNKPALSQLLRREDLLTLVPYDTQDTLDSLPGLLRAANIVLLQKPLLWHTFERRIAASSERRLSTARSQALRFAPEVEVLNGSSNSVTKLFQEPTSAAKNYTILLVEDNPINRKLGAKMLTALHYHTLLANDGEDALSMLLSHDDEIDCVLMDQSMPRMDGVTATGMIRRMEEEGRLRSGRPIIAVTAVVNSEAKGEFREAGADDFLAKPLSLERLRDCLVVYLPR